MIRVKLAGTIIGDGKVKICIPISAQNDAELAEELEYIAASPCDIAEVRFDYWQGKAGPSHEGILENVKRKLGKTPLLFTYRTSIEGGLGTNSRDDYYSINAASIRSGHIDLIDIEFAKEPELVVALIEMARKSDIKVIVSKHFFGKSLSKDEIIETLCKMQNKDADIIKLAVSVYDDKGARDVISAAKEMYEKYAKIPLVTIGMGEHGKVTRRIEPFYGSAITYARGIRATAPGQLDWRQL